METRELLFELANPVRYDILRRIAEKPRHLTKLAVLVDASAPEVSRHMERLGAVGVAEKNADGKYTIAPVGHIVLNCLPSLEFVSREFDYFSGHDLSLLPPSFISRLGDLGAGELRSGELGNIELVLGMLRRAEKKVRLLTVESFSTPSPDGGSPLASMQERLDYRLVIDKRYNFPGTGGEPPDSLRELTRRVPRIPAASVVTECEAAVSFPARDGKLDYSAGFYSRDGRFMRWCSDLIEFLWREGSRITRTNIEC